MRHPQGDRPRRLVIANWRDRDHPDAGGAEVVCEELVTVVCAPYRGCRARVEDGVRYVHAGLPAGYWLSIVSYFASIPWALWRYDSEVVVEDFGAPLSSVAVPWLTGRPVVAVVQWLFAAEKWRQYRIPFHLCEAVGVRSHRRMIAVSEELGSLLARRNHRARVAVVANGLEDEAFEPRERPRRGIGFLGRIETAQKGLDLLVAAYARAAAHIEQDLYIGGDGPDRDRLEALAADLGIDGRVHFAGRVAQGDRFDWLAGFEMVAMPSRYESFGMVAAEALAVGTPVVAFDVDAFAAAIRRLAGDAALARSLGARGPARVAGLRWDRLAGVQAGLYRAAIEGSPFGEPEPDPAPVVSPALL